MQINPDILLAWGAVSCKCKKNHPFFREGDEPRYYFQIILGHVKVVNINSDGKEYIQGVFGAGDSFGEPPLIVQRPYPTYAFAADECIVLKLARDRFFQVMAEYPMLQKELLYTIADRIYNKSINASQVIQHRAEDRIVLFLSQLTVGASDRLPFSYIVPYTRQELANFTGLRVETIIRTIKLLEMKNKLKIKKGKIYI